MRDPVVCYGMLRSTGMAYIKKRKAWPSAEVSVISTGLHFTNICQKNKLKTGKCIKTPRDLSES